MNFTIDTVDASDTLQIRQAILRPEASADECVLDGDDHADTRHYAAFVDLDGVRTQCGVASIYLDPPTCTLPPAKRSDAATDGIAPRTMWRIRGVATLQDWRRRGVARWLVTAAMQHAYDQGGELVWCNARTPAVPLYSSLGFEIEGEEFDIPGVGDHFLMWRLLA